MGSQARGSLDSSCEWGSGKGQGEKGESAFGQYVTWLLSHNLAPPTSSRAELTPPRPAPQDVFLRHWCYSVPRVNLGCGGDACLACVYVHIGKPG